MINRLAPSLATAVVVAAMAAATLQPARADVVWSDISHANPVPAMNELPQAPRGPYPSYMSGVIGPQASVGATTRVFALAPSDATPGFFAVSGHVAYCMDRFRTYNVATDSYRGYDGANHRCISPY